MVLAIDPGTLKTAYVLLCPETRVPLEFGKINNENMLLKLISILDIHTDDLEIVCEFPMPRGQLASTHLFETVEWIGRYHQLVFQKGSRFQHFDRKDVKMTICGTSKAKDPQIRAALIDIYGGEDLAIGGKKCKNCAGKGTKGRLKTTCPECQGMGVMTPPGPLNGVSADVWAALGIGVSFLEMRRLTEVGKSALRQLPTISSK